MNEDDEIWAGTVGDNWTFTTPPQLNSADDIFRSVFFDDDYLKSGAALTIEMLYDTMYKMTGDPRYKREEKCKVIFEDVITTLP